jgi:hypothetical protein
VENKNINPPFVPASVTYENTIPLCHMEQNGKNEEFFKVRKIMSDVLVCSA